MCQCTNVHLEARGSTCIATWHTRYALYRALVSDQQSFPVVQSDSCKIPYYQQFTVAFATPGRAWITPGPGTTRHPAGLCRWREGGVEREGGKERGEEEWKGGERK